VSSETISNAAASNLVDYAIILHPTGLWGEIQAIKSVRLTLVSGHTREKAECPLRVFSRRSISLSSNQNLLRKLANSTHFQTLNCGSGKAERTAL
jgi:hypothetical protein